MPVIQNVLADIRSGNGITAPGRVKHLDSTFGEKVLQGIVIVPIPHEESINLFRHHLPHSLRPHNPAVRVFRDVRLIQHTDGNVAHVLHLLAQPLLPQLIGDGGQPVCCTEALRLDLVIGNDHNQLLALGRSLNDLVQMPTVGRAETAEVNAGFIHGRNPFPCKWSELEKSSCPPILLRSGRILLSG